MTPDSVIIPNRLAASEPLGSVTLLDWTLAITEAVDAGAAKLWLDPFHPFRRTEDVATCLEVAKRNGTAGTFAELSFHPSWMLRYGENKFAEKLYPADRPWNGGASAERVFRTAGTVAFAGEHDTTNPYSDGVAHVIVAEPMDARTPSRLRMCRALLRDPDFVATLDPVLQRLA